MNVGFIGLGSIGAPMCARLRSGGFDVVGYDVRADAVAAAGVRPAASPAAVAAAAPIVCLSLPDDRVVADVLFGAQGVAAGARAGSTVVDLSTSRPSASRRAAERLAALGVAMLDAPVSGGVARAREGKLAIMVGGDADVLARCRPVLERLGEAIFHVGGPGAGEVAKLVNNLISGATLAVTLEALAVGVKAGVAAERLVDVVNASSGRSNSSEVKLPRYVLNRRFDAGFGTALMQKDLRLALELADEVGAPVPVGAVARQLWQLADPGLDHTALALVVERLVGTRLEASRGSAAAPGA